jgi:hypothetical protein
MKKIFVLYDGRAKDGDPDSAEVMGTAHSEQEALKASRTAQHDAVWYEYDVDGNRLLNGKPRLDLSSAESPAKRQVG